MLYVGAALMIGASIYGFVDYKKTSQEKEFTGMYADEKEPPVAVTVDEKKEPAVNPINKEVTTKKKATVVKKEEIRKEEIQKEEIALAPVKPIAEDEKMFTGESKKIEPATVAVTPAKEHSVYKKIKRKKLNTKIFSRAPLREEVEEVTVLPAPVKTKAKKD